MSTSISAPDTAELLNRIGDFLAKYVSMGRYELDAVALWVLHTHAFRAAEMTPYLNVTSGTKGCGKTLLMEMLNLLVRRPWLLAGATPAVLARKIAKDTPTLLFDEFDAMLKGSSDRMEAIRAILNSGFRKTGSTAVCVPKGDGFEAATFPTFCPKAIAGIGDIPDTVASRSITITLQRKAPHSSTARFHFRDVEPMAAALHQSATAWAEQNTEDLANRRPSLPRALSDRTADCWEPLLAIAELAGGDWPVRAWKAAIDLANRAKPNDPDLALVADVRAVFSREDVTRLRSIDLCRLLSEIEEAIWQPMYGPLKPNQLSKLLRPLGIKPIQLRMGSETHKGYDVSWFDDYWHRYGNETDEHALDIGNIGNIGNIVPHNVAGSNEVAASESVADTANVSDVSDVSELPQEPISACSRFTVFNGCDDDQEERFGACIACGAASALHALSDRSTWSRIQDGST